MANRQMLVVVGVVDAMVLDLVETLKRLKMIMC